MGKYFFFVSFLTLFLIEGIGQQSVFTDFDTQIWADEFETPGSEMWRQTTNAEEIFIIQNGAYILFRKDKFNHGLVFPNEKTLFSSHKAEFKITLDDDNDKTGSAGVIVMAQEDGKGAFLIEINGKSQYRIAKYNGYVFKTIVDWKKNSVIESRGDANIITLVMEDKRYDLYINNEFVTSFSEVSYKTGKIGLYVGPQSKVNVDYVRVYVTAQEKENILKQQDKSDEPKDDPVLTEVIKKMREQMVNLEVERDSLRVIVTQLKQDLKNANKKTGDNGQTQKLKTENTELKAEIERLKKENNKLAVENQNLRDFKETITNSDNGDIIITLTQALETERQRIEILADENEKLYEEIRKLKERLKN